jgi:4-diphosphocytidyl-2-C-methyl-D-erythritol kinase
VPCKINIHLGVGEKRSDGFHELESIFAALDFADTLTITPLPEEEGRTPLVMRAEGPFSELSRLLRAPPIPLENNLVCRAAELFRAKTGFSGSLAAELVKRIPPGSGLGGGSSDAAAALLALNSLAFPRSTGKAPLSRKALMDLAAQLGSDVPFFVQIAGPRDSPACLVTGRGEYIKPLPPPPPLGVLLAFPGFASDTRAAFALLDTVREEPGTPNHYTRTGERVFSKNAVRRRPGNCPAYRTSRSVAGEWGVAADFWAQPESWNFHNDFLELFLRHGTEQEKKAYNAILSGLRDAGAVFTGLSGSGSACFGIFSGIQAAERARKSLSGAFFTLQTTFFLRS